MNEAEGDRGRRGEQRGERGGRLCRALWAEGRNQVFTPGEVGALEGCGQRRAVGRGGQGLTPFSALRRTEAYWGSPPP